MILHRTFPKTMSAKIGALLVMYYYILQPEKFVIFNRISQRKHDDGLNCVAQWVRNHWLWAYFYFLVHFAHKFHSSHGMRLIFLGSSIVSITANAMKTFPASSPNSSQPSSQTLQASTSAPQIEAKKS